MFLPTLFFRIIIIVVLFIPSLCFSQTNEQNVEYENTYDGGTLFLKNRERINFKHISFTDNFAVIQKENSMLLDTMDYSNINFIRAETGDNGIICALIGGLFGFGVVLELAIHSNDEINASTAIIATIACATLGYLTGHNIKNIKTIYQRGSFKIDLTPIITYNHNNESYEFLTINIQLK